MSLNGKTILIIGMAGGLARLTAGLLAKKYPDLNIIGVDSRHTDKFVNKKNIQYIKMRYTRGNFEKVFRDHKFDIVMHLGRIGHAQSATDIDARLDLNLMGTQRILDLCLKFAIKRVVILSTFHVYGALIDNTTYIKEDSPLRASIKYPELRDVVEMDQLCTSWMWKNQRTLDTVILRPCNIIGPQIKNTISEYLDTPYAPLGMDYNPMFQFIHEFDMASILLKACDDLPTGLYNVAPDETISIKEARKIVGHPSLPVPLFILEQLAKVLKKMWRFPDYLIEYIMFPCIIDNTEIKKHLPADFFRFKTREALELLRLS